MLTLRKAIIIITLIMSASLVTASTIQVGPPTTTSSLSEMSNVEKGSVVIVELASSTVKVPIIIPLNDMSNVDTGSIKVMASEKSTAKPTAGSLSELSDVEKGSVTVMELETATVKVPPSTSSKMSKVHIGDLNVTGLETSTIKVQTTTSLNNMSSVDIEYINFTELETSTVKAPTTTSVNNMSSVDIGYMNVTELETSTVPTTTSFNGMSNVHIGYMNVTELETSTVKVPTTTSLNEVSNVHIGYMNIMETLGNAKDVSTNPSSQTEPTWSSLLTDTITTDSPMTETEAAGCLPWFHCDHGNCTGGMSCTCFEGWAGLFCDVSCPTDCPPYGTCLTSSSNQAVCACNETSVYSPGSGCVGRTPAPSTTTTESPSTTPADLRSLEERECLGIFTCVHGYCQETTLMCECDQDWRGPLCDQTCDLHCGDHGKCRENREFMMYCECDPFYGGDTCDNFIQSSSAATTATTIFQSKNSTSDSMAKTGPVSTGSDNNLIAEAGNASGRSVAGGSKTYIPATTMRPIRERECLPGFVCQHGYCEKGQISCVCDAGWAGVFCNVACILSCGEKGTCAFYDEESQYCKCEQGYISDSSCDEAEGGTQVPTSNTSLLSKTSPRPSTRFTTRGGEDDPVPTSNTSLSNESSPSPSTRFNASDGEDDPWRHLESKNRQLPPYDQRICLPGYTCAFGNCSRGENSLAQCLCEAGFTGTFCEKPCPIDCGQHGECIYNFANNTPECYCHFQYTGPNCTEIIPQEDTESMSVVWVLCLAAGLFLLSLLLLVVLPFVLYKRRNITMMKIVHWFQPFEEDDNRDYDAFVSYASSTQDTQFVLHTLIPKLEDRMNFTLCIHQRNFTPGQFISDNIMESVKRSRRTLLIVSPSFVNSGWCRFEYQMALQEMLNEKHRVLPIVIGDISSVMENIDDALKRILRTVTWLEYPSKNASEQEHEKFWKRLELSMPKKRRSHIESGNGQVCLAMPASLLSTESSLHKMAPQKTRPGTNEYTNNRLLQRIIRVPAFKLDSYNTKFTPAGLTFDRFLEKRQDVDSQNGTIGSAFINDSSCPHNSESSLSEICGDAAGSSTFDASETEHMNDVPESPDLSDLRASSRIPAQNDETLVTNNTNDDSNCQEEDLPVCMLHNYLGDLNLETPVIVQKKRSY